jgi:hypothetical protein
MANVHHGGGHEYDILQRGHRATLGASCSGNRHICTAGRNRQEKYLPVALQYHADHLLLSTRQRALAGCLERSLIFHCSIIG